MVTLLQRCIYLKCLRSSDLLSLWRVKLSPSTIDISACCVCCICPTDRILKVPFEAQLSEPALCEDDGLQLAGRLSGAKEIQTFLSFIACFPTVGAAPPLLWRSTFCDVTKGTHISRYRVPPSALFHQRCRLPYLLPSVWEVEQSISFSKGLKMTLLSEAVNRGLNKNLFSSSSSSSSNYHYYYAQSCCTNDHLY